MIIFINGTISSGKSTIAKLLEKKIPNTVVLEIDALRDLINWMPLEEAIPLNLENAVSLITNFVGHKFNVIVPYPLSEKNHDYLTKNLEGLDTEKYTFTLTPKPEELTKEQRGRKLSDWEKERIQYHTKIGLTAPSFGELIDNTNQTPEETAEVILNFVKKEKSST